MQRLFTLFSIFFQIFINTQVAVSQDIPKSNQVVFYNFSVSKCTAVDCQKPYQVQLANTKTVQGTFKGVNERIKPAYEENTFLITAYDKRSGNKLYETVVANPVELSIEYDGHDGHNHQPATGLCHQVVSLPEGVVAVRLPFSPDECTVHVAYIEQHDRIIDLATF